MDFKDVVKSRYSCKKFNSEKVISSDQLNAILEAGRLAPTAKNLQEQHIYVAQKTETLQIIDKVTPCRYGAPTVLVVAYNKNDVYTYPDSTRTSGIEDATIVATHMILAAQNEGIDSCWVNCFSPERLHKLLNFPSDEEILMLLDLGYAAEGTGPLPNHFDRKNLTETVSYI